MQTAISHRLYCLVTKGTQRYIVCPRFLCSGAQLGILSLLPYQLHHHAIKKQKWLIFITGLILILVGCVWQT